ncbi:MAG TPA: hypothetical protein VHA06_01595, partial [Candidatus Angelobacter sp.]|nr:hypothetical protein [Candidatus Angelobacter sp.]
IRFFFTFCGKNFLLFAVKIFTHLAIIFFFPFWHASRFFIPICLPNFYNRERKALRLMGQSLRVPMTGGAHDKRRDPEKA